MVRCFIALDLPEVLLDEIKRVQDELRKLNLFAGKYVDPGNMHLTLKFLGEISENQVEDVKERLKAVQFEGFQGSLGNLGVFSEKFIRVIWVLLNGKQIFELQKQVDDSLSDFPKNGRFSSHITLVRVKKVEDKDALLEALKKLEVKDAAAPIRYFSFIKSTLTPEGPEYEVIEKYGR